MDVFAGALKNEDELIQCASGGAATAISNEVLRRKGVVFGVAYTKDFRSAEYISVESKTDLDRIKGSKYVETEKDLKKVADTLLQGKMTLFIGLGCDVAAIKAYCNRKNIKMDNLYTIDILCHGPVSREVHRKFIEDLEKKYKSRVVSFNERYKKEGWVPSYLKVVFENGKVYEELFEFTDLGYVFSKFPLSRCTNCHFKGSNHQGDICIGDCFGISKNMEGYNKNGVSCIIIQTEKGKQILELLDDSFELNGITEEIIVDYNPMYYKSRKKNVDYEQFNKMLSVYGLHNALKRNSDYKKWKKGVRTIKVKRKLLSILKK